jgi:hypothetical protein
VNGLSSVRVIQGQTLRTNLFDFFENGSCDKVMRRGMLQTATNVRRFIALLETVRSGETVSCYE